MVNKSKLVKLGSLTALFLFLLVLTSISVSASFYSDFNDKQKGNLGYVFCEWREGGFFIERTSNQDGCNGNIPYLSNNTIISTLAVGANFQPLISNFVDGGDNYLITPSGTDIDVLGMSSLGGLSLSAQINLGSAITTQPIMVDLNGDNYTDMLVTNGISLLAIYYNISDPATFTIHTIYTGTISTGIACMNVSTDIYCFMGGSGGTGASAPSNLSVYNASSGTVTNYEVNVSSFSSAINYEGINVPIIKDLDNDGYLEMVIITDVNGNGQEGFTIFQLTSGGIPTIEVTVNDIEASASSWVFGLTTLNLDGVGDTEICAAATAGNT